MQSRSRGALRRRSGFRLTELMITCVILCVLASVAFPAFTKAKESTYKSDLLGALHVLGTAEEIYADVNGTFAGDIADLDMKLSPGITVVDYVSVGGTYWSVLLKHNAGMVRCNTSYEAVPTCWTPDLAPPGP